MKKLFISALLITGSLFAQDWDVPGAGDWNVAGNWSPATVPDDPELPPHLGELHL